MSDINSMNVANVGFPEDDGLNIDEIFGGGDNADADLPPIENADIFADTPPESADAVPVTDSQTVSVSEEPESASANSGAETSESPAQSKAESADAVPVTDSQTVSASEEAETASAVPGNKTPESPASGDKDAVPAQESANASATAKPPKNGEKNPETSRKPNRKKTAAKKAGQSENANETNAAQEAEPDLFAAFADGDADTPLSTTETETPAADSQPQSLFDKLPVFSYGGAKEKIEDSSQTFEELRILKADDFPELGEGKSVSWKVKYGTVTKSVSDPKNATIASVKEEIEKSRTFLDGLAKAKDKNPDCLVIPSVTAKSKGTAIAAYKGVFHTPEAARKSDKLICLIPARDGRVYEMRKTEVGEMVVPKSRVAEFAEVRAGFVPALPRIPREVTGRIISFFRSFMNESAEYEALVFVYWDRQNEEFVEFIPRQRTTKASVYANLMDNCLPEERYLHYADIHSHNSMEAKFSAVDDRDEKASRLYIVVGRLNNFYPSVSARISCGGTYLPIDPELVMEGVGEEFPAEWLDRVERVPVRKGADEETEEESLEDAERTPIPECLRRIVLRVAPREFMEES